ncbi:MAG: UvrD-helicase domain-containing protein [Pseudomonadota bacterium]
MTNTDNNNNAQSELILTQEQEFAIKELPALSSVISCPGSGKTLTAALRMANRLSTWEHKSSGIALLSHTNVAIDSFTKEFIKLGYSGLPQLPHFVGTLDGFLTQFLLANFGHLVMNCQRKPTLIHGGEKFLENNDFKVWFPLKNGANKHPVKVSDLCIGLSQDSKPYIYQDLHQTERPPVNAEYAKTALYNLAAQGFYSHNHARYWAFQILEKYPKIRKALAHRFREVIVDEAQDTNLWQQKILDKFIQEGCQISLIGDPDQSIFEFGQADTSYLIDHSQKEEVYKHKLSKNHRSNKAIVEVAKPLSTFGTIEADRECDEPWHGAYIMSYTDGQENELLELFRSRTIEWGLEKDNCVAVARANNEVKKLRGENTNLDNSSTHQFIKATIQRDNFADPRSAYEIVDKLVLHLCDTDKDWTIIKNDPNQKELYYSLRKHVWQFVRDSNNGLPSATLKAKTEWHPKLKNNLRVFYSDLDYLPHISQPENLGQKIAAKNLEDIPISHLSLSKKRLDTIRVDTVHGVKGESLDATLYLANEKQITPVIKRFEGSRENNELVKIGYVAMTRPKHVLWLAIPEKTFNRKKDVFKNVGFHELAE